MGAAVGEPCSDLRIGGQPLVDLVRDYHRPMVGFARTLVGSASAAEEVVQEAWLQVIKSAATFEGRSHEATWLFGIVRNTALRHRRRESTIREHEQLAQEGADPLEGRMHPPGHPQGGHWSVPPTERFLPENHVVAQELAEELRLALEEIPPRQRQLVILRYVVGLSAEEAGEVAQVDGQAQRALLYRARGNLRSALERRCSR